MKTLLKYLIFVVKIGVVLAFWPFVLWWVITNKISSSNLSQKPKVGLIAISSILFLILGVSWVQAMSSPTPPPETSSNATPTPSPSSVLVPSPSPTTNPLDAMQKVKITRVIDGDTIEIDSGLKIRYIGIDTPETVDPNKPTQCFGTQATQKNKELVEGKEVYLEKDVSDTDKFGRLLRYVWIDENKMVNEVLVNEGYAQSSTYPPDVKYQDRLLTAQTSARENSRGLWSACASFGAPEPTTSPITNTKLIVPPPINNSSENTTSCDIKGNISNSREKIFHVPGCGSYNKTVIDTSKGERFFCSEQEAISAGWRKALNCP